MLQIQTKIRALSRMKKILIALDFDHTIINANSDTYIYKLAPNGVIPEELKKLYKTSGWTLYMGEIFKFLHKNGITKSQILDCMTEINLTGGMRELFVGVDIEKTDFIIISDSNTVFIDTILKHNKLDKYIKNTFTNFAEFDSRECLRIEKYHVQDWCSLSTNNLCKGDILSKYITTKKNEGIYYSYIAYVGDGSNDFCPSLRLLEHDMVFPRKGYNLIKNISKLEQEKNLKLTAKIHPWDSGNDILQNLLPLYTLIEESMPIDPRVIDPGKIEF